MPKPKKNKTTKRKKSIVKKKVEPKVEEPKVEEVKVEEKVEVAPTLDKLAKDFVEAPVQLANIDIPIGPGQILWELGWTKKIDRPALFKNLNELHEVYNRHGIKHWLILGTLLGVYREGDFIAHDDDADLACFVDDKSKMEAVRTEMRALGYHVPNCGDRNKPVHPQTNMPWYDEVYIRDGQKIEVWFFEKKTRPDGEYWIYDEPRCGDHMKVPAKYFNTFGSIDFKGVQYNIPAHIEEYLVMMYGPNWRIPDPNKKYNAQG